MKVDTKFDIGQDIWYLKSARTLEQTTVKCNICKGEGKVKLGSESFICPKCNGKGDQVVTTYSYEPQKVRIEEITLTKTTIGCSNDIRSFDKLVEKYTVSKGRSRYNRVTLYSHDHIFTSKKDCQAWIKEHADD